MFNIHRDFENAYQKFKTDGKGKPLLPSNVSQVGMKTPVVSTANSSVIVTSIPGKSIITSAQNAEYIDLEDLPKIKKLDVIKTSLSNAMVTTTPSTTVEVKSDLLVQDGSSTKPQKSTLEKLASKISGSALGDSLTLPIPGGSNDSSELSPDGSISVNANHGGIASNVPGFIPKTSPPINEKKERDESWKKYLTR